MTCRGRLTRSATGAGWRSWTAHAHVQAKERRAAASALVSVFLMAAGPWAGDLEEL
jgi:hypothetical protein